MNMSKFPTKDNPKLCDNNCGTKIYLSNKNERKKWLPYELDGEFHKCPNKPNPGLDKYSTATTSTATTTSENNHNHSQNQEMTIQQLKTWIDRLEKVRVHIDIDSILNPQKDQKEKQQQ